MNELVKKQLKKCRTASLPPYNDSTTQMLIPKLSDMNGSSLIPGHYYIIELSDYLINPPQDFVLHDNWNNGIVPKCKYFKCECVRIMGKMMKIEGVGYDKDTDTDLNISWGGWLPINGVKVIGELGI